MDFTLDYFVYMAGILLGVCLTLIGVWFTEFLKDRKEKIRLTKAFRTEVANNLRKAEYNILVIGKLRGQTFQLFHTTAYEKLKSFVLLDWKNSDLSNSIFKGFAIAEEYNNYIKNPEYYKIRQSAKIAKLEAIKKEMNAIKDLLKDCKNIECLLGSK